MIEIETTIVIKCDRCGRAFVPLAAMQAGEPIGTAAQREMQGIEAVHRISLSIDKLREKAQVAGWCYVPPVANWCYVLPEANPSADLCPRCYQPPPEG